MKVQWMLALQLSGGLKYPALETLIKENPEQGEALLSLSGSVDDPADIFSKSFHLSLRIDICLSQALAHAVTAIQLLVRLASLGIPSYIKRLKSSLIAGVLISVESLLSAQGHEMGMIEDLDGIMPLLNTVSFRFVSQCVSTAVAPDNTTFKMDDKEKASGSNQPQNVSILRDVVSILVQKRIA
jgi:hypothetical protein